MKKISVLQLLVALALMISACAKGGGTIENPDTGDPDTSPFTKNVLIMEFVSFDCVYCPAVSNVLQELSEKTYPGRIDVVSVHGRLEEDDPMEFKGYQQFQNYFYGVTGYPAVILDQRDDLISVGMFDASSDAFSGRINVAAPIGIALSSTLTGDNTVRVEVQVANKGKSSADYRLAVAVVENDIAYRQADLVNGSQQWIDDYRHQHVLRAFLSENYFGDPIGSLAEDGTYSKTFVYTVPAEYQADNLSFVAYVVEAKGFSSRVSVNSRTVPIGKAIDF